MDTLDVKSFAAPVFGLLYSLCITKYRWSTALNPLILSLQGIRQSHNIQCLCLQSSLKLIVNNCGIEIIWTSVFNQSMVVCWTRLLMPRIGACLDLTGWADNVFGNAKMFENVRLGQAITPNLNVHYCVFVLLSFKVNSSRHGVTNSRN